MNLGNWTSNLNYYRDMYNNAEPFENVIIKDFFNNDYANEIYDNIPTPIDNNENWKHYDNPIEQKYSLNNFKDYPKMIEIFNLLQSSDFLELIKQITNINNLEIDPYLHGAGIHAYPNNGKLDIHLDYNIHPISGKERRINIIIYMNKNWKPEYGGGICLYDKDMNKIKEYLPDFNSMIIFRTSDISYHGLPIPIKCPINEFRKSIAIYYVSEPRDNLTQRFKANFFPHPKQELSDGLKKLYEIRKNRLLTNDDLETHYPNWKNEKSIYW